MRKKRQSPLRSTLWVKVTVSFSLSGAPKRVGFIYHEVTKTWRLKEYFVPLRFRALVVILQNLFNLRHQRMNPAASLSK